ncbi:aldo/keto reductase [Candidatus Kaiserbacteria bacterium CG10_big_fil_rev_8_21_14_0_10_51_14]|uniref:Aldo/keto reductase n=1 Tax=Candidatus Kaiserbacteria bacterium CG10_big_fil_rev_8_21_14_0_10_51_14 TaxID=1974610 RepID=A0A2H0UBW0_9BACT|nr:MAG: aldo/keto reductase [Candidatus Kaiserbacteria bacterium CG10_big_fil_rev_8_21_14_0_10_51_14]
METNIYTRVRLNNGIEMPILGLGTWNMTDAEAENSVMLALEADYRLIDTARLYGNEWGVGKAVRESGIPREDMFVTTKLWPTDFGNPKQAFDESLKRLGLEYIDLYLIHWPVAEMPQSLWRALEKIYESKKVRAIGVSNYGIGDIEKLLEYAVIPPAVNQIKFSPFDYAEEILRCCQQHDIIVEAYSPLTRGSQLDHPLIVELSKKYKKTPAHIMIRWCIEHETIPIPKSTHKQRIEENRDVFDFSIDEKDMRALDSLS